MSRGTTGDNKFVLYQILYIVILTIMVYKGAELTLSKVAESNVPEVASKLISDKYKKDYEKEKERTRQLRLANLKLNNEINILKNQITDLETRMKQNNARTYFGETRTGLQGNLGDVIDIVDMEELFPTKQAQIYKRTQDNIIKNSAKKASLYLYDRKNAPRPLLTLAPGSQGMLDLSSIDADFIYAKFKNPGGTIKDFGKPINVLQKSDIYEKRARKYSRVSMESLISGGKSLYDLIVDKYEKIGDLDFKIKSVTPNYCKEWVTFKVFPDVNSFTSGILFVKNPGITGDQLREYRRLAKDSKCYDNKTGKYSIKVDYLLYDKCYYPNPASLKDAKTNAHLLSKQLEIIFDEILE